jgi:hypothetical protein
MRLKIFTHQGVIVINAPEDWTTLHFEDVCSKVHLDGFFFWPSPPCYIPAREISLLLLDRGDGGSEVIFDREPQPGRVN